MIDISSGFKQASLPDPISHKRLEKIENYYDFYQGTKITI
jgi:hypothetical protein